MIGKTLQTAKRLFSPFSFPFSFLLFFTPDNHLYIFSCKSVTGTNSFGLGSVFGSKVNPSKNTRVSEDDKQTNPSWWRSARKMTVFMTGVWWQCRERERCNSSFNNRTQRFVSAGTLSVSF